MPDPADDEALHRTGSADAGRDRARQRVADHEASLDPQQRRALAAHYTPEELARRLVRLALDAFGGTSGTSGSAGRALVCDPSCGAGSVLLAAADELVERGVDPRAVIEEHLVGFDLDADSIVVARSALVDWAAARGVRAVPVPRVVQADAIRSPTRGAPFDVVVGNPPFSSPLSSVGLSSGPGSAGPGSAGLGPPVLAAPGDGPAGAYTDLSALHLLSAVRMTRAGGVTCLLQPQSVLAARDTTELRSQLARLAVLEGLWASDEDLFDSASVRVCAPLLRRLGPTAAPSRDGTQRDGTQREGAPPRSVAVGWRDYAPVSREDPGPARWASLLASMVGVPAVARPTGSVPLSQVARCTAGFRDEFYALAAATREGPPEAPGSTGGTRQAGAAEGPRVVSAGMIDPGALRWGDRRWRIAGEHYTCPFVDMATLASEHPRVHRWVLARQVPKVLVASQTKVLEVVADTGGSWLPLTPVVSVEPVTGWSPQVLAAMLSAPSNTALLWSVAAGTGRSSAALRVGASALGALCVNEDTAAHDEACRLWAELGQLAQRRAGERRWIELGTSLDRVVGFAGDRDVARFWAARLPRRLVGDPAT